MYPEPFSEVPDGWIIVLMSFIQREEADGQAMRVLALLAYLLPCQSFGENKLLLMETCPNNTQTQTQVSAWQV